MWGTMSSTSKRLSRKNGSERGKGTMNAFTGYLLALHQQDLLQAAELHRRAKLVRDTRTSVPAWRRALGGGARGLSGLFAHAARSLDPSVEARRSSRKPAGRRGARVAA